MQTSNKWQMFVCSCHRIHLQFAPVVLLGPECRCAYKNAKGKSTAKLKKWIFLSHVLFSFLSFHLKSQDADGIITQGQLQPITLRQ
jgi:hypothetical protein